MSAAPSFERYGGSYLRYVSVDVITSAGLQFAILDRKTSQLLRAANAPRRTWLFADPDEAAGEIERLEATVAEAQ
jgi:hypothetical protein